MNVDIAERLATRRRERGLSQEALADKLGVTRQAVSKWERSESSPDTDNLIALAELYGVSLDDLLYVDVSIKDDVEFEQQDRADRHNSEQHSAARVDTLTSRPTDQQYDAARVNEQANEQADNQHGAPQPDEQADKQASEEPDDGRTCCSNGEKVHVSFKDGIHVDDGKDKVHINWKDGIHVEGDGEKVHVSFADGIHVEKEDAHGKTDEWDWHEGGWRRTSAWLKFPFPVLVTCVYLLVGFIYDAWVIGLFVFFSIPLYYIIVHGIVKHKASDIFFGIYPLLTACWFLWMCANDQPHPAWIIFLTIPLYEWAAHSIRNWYRRKRQLSQEELMQ
ncbi:MAG: helix-turn-helix domain-containing protein [Coriobacteriales bacterium]|jgi:HTH-type transcriptional regulator/antitoxin HipB|nr:helix-turn-helix domain-containing protein [Coriobacteriales bacterium]